MTNSFSTIKTWILLGGMTFLAFISLVAIPTAAEHPAPPSANTMISSTVIGKTTAPANSTTYTGQVVTSTIGGIGKDMFILKLESENGLRSSVQVADEATYNMYKIGDTYAGVQADQLRGRD